MTFPEVDLNAVKEYCEKTVSSLDEINKSIIVSKSLDEYIKYLDKARLARCSIENTVRDLEFSFNELNKRLNVFMQSIKDKAKESEEVKEAFDYALNRSFQSSFFNTEYFEMQNECDVR